MRYLFVAAFVAVACTACAGNQPETVAARSGSSTPEVSWQAGTEAGRQDLLADWYAWADREHWYAVASWHEAETARQPVRTVVNRRPTGGHRGSGTIEACIAARENGGDYGRSSNPTHFGRYQYDRQTWAAHGGDPATWGSASPEEQDRVFANGTAQYGYGAWTRYDGCG